MDYLNFVPKQITYFDLVDMSPCYSPDEIGIPENYSAHISDFIKEYRHKVRSLEDIIWVVCRSEYMTDQDMRLFAVWCARQALKKVKTPDPIIMEICTIAESYAKGAEGADELIRINRIAFEIARSTPRPDHTPYIAVYGSTKIQERDAAWSASWSAIASVRRDEIKQKRNIQIDKLLTYFEQ